MDFTYCDSCLTAACDLGADDPEDQAEILATMGADLPDHNCDHVEEPEIPCDCEGHR